MAANVIDVAETATASGGRWRIVRQRWAGSLLEEAWLDGRRRLLTVAPHAVAPAEAARRAPRPKSSRLART